MSQSSGCYDSDGQEQVQGDDGLEGHRYSGNVADSSFERNSRSSGLRRQAIQNWHRRPYRNSTEGEEGDISDVGSRTTESEAEVWEQESIGSAELNTDRSSGAGRPKGGSCLWLFSSKLIGEFYVWICLLSNQLAYPMKSM